MTKATPLPPGFQVERFMADLLEDVRITCPDCSGYGWTPVEGCAVECDRCAGLGRIMPEAYTDCTTCGMRIANVARLDCNSGCAS